MRFRESWHNEQRCTHPILGQRTSALSQKPPVDPGSMNPLHPPAWLNFRWVFWWLQGLALLFVREWKSPLAASSKMMAKENKTSSIKPQNATNTWEDKSRKVAIAHSLWCSEVTLLLCGPGTIPLKCHHEDRQGPSPELCHRAGHWLPPAPVSKADGPAQGPALLRSSVTSSAQWLEMLQPLGPWRAGRSHSPAPTTLPLLHILTEVSLAVLNKCRV